MSTTQNPVLCALDTTDAERAAGLARSLDGLIGGIKLGLEFFCARGPEGVRRVADSMPLFLDLKLHDIPNTVAAAVRSVLTIEPLLLTLHASGGADMMRAAVTAAGEARELGLRRPKLIGVTVMTSLDDGDLDAVGQHGPVADQVLRLADLARECGLDGVVCSPLEVISLRRRLGPDFTLVVPGIRPEGGATHDQKRVRSPREALNDGADYLVIGRPITEAADPGIAARAIQASLSGQTSLSGSIGTPRP